MYVACSVFATDCGNVIDANRSLLHGSSMSCHVDKHSQKTVKSIFIRPGNIYDDLKPTEARHKGGLREAFTDTRLLFNSAIDGK